MHLVAANATTLYLCVFSVGFGEFILIHVFFTSHAAVNHSLQTWHTRLWAVSVSPSPLPPDSYSPSHVLRSLRLLEDLFVLVHDGGGKMVYVNLYHNMATNQ